jgi:putative inorganic carbon (hco3(-)) transporter
MRHRLPSAVAILGVAAAAAAIAGLALLPRGAADLSSALYIPLAALLLAGSLFVLVWWADPAYTMSAAIFLTPFGSNWPQFGIPGPLSPDRLLFAAAIGAILLRAPGIGDRPRLKVGAAHWLLGLAVLYAVTSAFVVGTITTKTTFLRIVDSFGIMPFLIFLTAPVVFRTQQERRILLISLVALGAYLGFTALAETAGVSQLVFPKYILNRHYGIHYGHARGPFADAVANGLAMYMCAVASAIALATWRHGAMRAAAGVVCLLGVVGAFLSLERSVWIAVVAGTTVAMLATRGMRRLFLPAMLGGVLVIGSALLLVPGLPARVHDRLSDTQTVWDRKNLDRAAINMIESRPLLGFGWGKFHSYSANYFQQAPDYPLSATTYDIHNTPLVYAVEIGLLGLALWLFGLLFGVGAALTTRAPPDLEPWRVGLLAVAVAFIVVVNAVPPTAWPNRSLWLFAGVVFSGRYLVGERDGESQASMDLISS